MIIEKKRPKRPPEFCSRGPYRLKRRYLEDLRRYDVRDYIDQAVPHVEEEDEWEDDLWEGEEDRFDISAIEGYAEVDPRDPRYTLFTAEVALPGGHRQRFQLYRGWLFPHPSQNQRHRFWFWLCPLCGRRCRYLYTTPDGTLMQCRVCWKLPYRSQSKSRKQRRQERRARYQPVIRPGEWDRFGGRYWLQGARRICCQAPQPPPGWIPADLLQRYLQERQAGQAPTTVREREDYERTQ